jgi:hypothetical protein
VEGHIGFDNRFYLIDIHRLFPAEDNFSTVYGVKIHYDPNKKWQTVTLSRNTLTEDIWSSFTLFLTLGFITEIEKVKVKERKKENRKSDY